MLKKRNIAMAMAVATVATSVAPAFAAVNKTEIKSEELVTKVKEALETTYHDGSTKLYKVYTKIGGGSATEATTIEALKVEMAKAEAQEKTLEVIVEDQGHFVENGRKVKTIEAEYKVYNADASTTDDDLYTEVNTFATANTTLVSKVAYFDVYDEKVETPAAGNVDKAIVTLKSGKEVTLEVADKKLDLTKGYDSLGNEITISSGTAASVLEKVESFKVKEETKATITAPKRVVETYLYNKQSDDKTTVNLNVKDLYVNNGYTKKGVEVLKMFIAANADTNKKTTVISGGKEYKIGIKQASGAPVISTNVTASENGGYEFKMTIEVQENVTNSVVKDIELVISGESLVALNKVKTDIVKTVDTDITLANDAVTNLSGDDRFATAIEVSKATIAKNDKAGSVVLVGADAIVDGLAAAPLAKQQNAPILLTNKDAVDTKTLEEMERVLPTNGTVYLIGGENVISKDVEKQLIDKLDVKIVRLAGEDRYETSIKIAKKLILTGNDNKAYVVGGDGLADAMSIAAISAKQTVSTASSEKAAPIIVSPSTGLTQDAKNFIYDNKTKINDIDVIGGETRVSKQVLKDIKDNSNLTAERVAGQTRQETNAEVINKYFGKDIVENVFVAQDGYVGGDSKLIDALAVAPLAGIKSAPIVLTTDSLTTEQEEVIETVINEKATSKSVYQVGGGVTSSVINKVLKLFGF